MVSGRAGQVLGAVLVAVFLHGLLYAVTLPEWDLFDEEPHFDYTLSLRDTTAVPRVDDPIDARILVSAAATDRWTHYRLIPPPSLDPEQAGTEGLSYESYQPPIYYGVLAIIMLPAGDGVRASLHLARLTGPLLLVALAAVTWGFARHWFPTAGPLVWGAAALVVGSIPAAAEAAGRVNPDLLAGVLVAAALLLCLRLLEHPTRFTALALGVVGSVAALTKTQGLAFVVVAVATIVVLWWRRVRDPMLVALAVLPGVAAAAAWAIFTHNRYGEWMAEDISRSVGLTWFDPSSPGTFWRSLWVGVWSSYWPVYDGGTMEVVVSATVVLVAAVGLVLFLRTGGFDAGTLLVGLLCVALFAVIWARDAAGLGVPQGRFLLAALPPVAALVVGGWWRALGHGAAVGVAVLTAALATVFYAGWLQSFLDARFV